MIQTLNLPRPERRSNGQTAPNRSPVNLDFFRAGSEADSGELVTPQSAMSLADVNAAVRLISGQVAASPLRLYRLTGNGREEAKDLPLHRMLTLEPSDECSAFTMIEAFVSSILLRGNGFIEIARDGSGQVSGLYWQNPHYVTPQRQADGSVVYRIAVGSSVRVLPSANVIHVPWHCPVDPLMGIGPIEQCRNTIGVALATEKFGARFFKNNATPSGVLSSKQKIAGTDKARMRSDWETLQTGGNQHRVAVLDQELEFQPLQLTNSDSQWIESMKFSRERIAGMFGLHASQIGSESRVAGETYAQQQLDFLQQCLSVHFAKIVAEFTRKLLNGRPDLELEFDISSRLKLDFKTMMEGFATAIQWGIACPQEARKALNYNPGPDSCNVFLSPVNMQNQQRLLNASAKPEPGGSNAETNE